MLNCSGRTLEVCEPCLNEDFDNRTDIFTVITGEEASGEKCMMKDCGSFRDVRPSGPFYRPHLFDLKEAVGKFKNSKGAASSVLSAAEVFGKAAANVGVIAGKAGYAAVVRTSEKMPEILDSAVKSRQVRIDEMRREGRVEEADEAQENLDEYKRRLEFESRRQG